MERFTRVLERVPVREQRADAKVAVVGAHNVADASLHFTDTVVFKTPVVELDPIARDNARILPPSADGPIAGAYKMLRTQVLRRLDQLGANTLGVVSSSTGEGKTLTAINLAIAIAADPARTALLVDFDLRNPSIYRRFNYAPEVGVEDCLESRRAIQETMFKVAGYERLTIAAAVRRVPNSSELLSSARAAELVGEIRARYANRVVIFDLPPVLQADDALAFSRNLQAGLLVVGEAKAKREDVTRTLQLLGDLKFVGTVLNGSRERAQTYY